MIREISERVKEKGSRRGQLAIFVIVALVIVAGIIIFFAFRGQIDVELIPEEFVPVYELYSGCIEQEVSAAVNLAGTQGGRIYLDDYTPGSEYAPTGSQLNFLGFPVPYWYYISGNGLIKENVPKKSDIENEIAEFVEERLGECRFDEYYQQGFFVDLGDPEVRVKIFDDKLDVDVSSNVFVSRGDMSARKELHKVSVNSKMGGLFNEAEKIYEFQKESGFLENYAVDVLRLNAPVDGVEISCASKVWKTQEVIKDLKEGLEANIQAIKFKGDYYDLKSKEDEYFVVESEINEAVQMLYSRDWPTRIEITDADELLIADPVGNREGLGILGFCYVPYHFVYDLSFPVLIQVHDGLELFQFPVVVIVDNNVPREAVFSEVSDVEEFDLCEFKSQDIEVNLFDVGLNRVDGSVSYSCFNQKCFLGETEDGRFAGKIPGCVNGYLEIRSDGFSDKRELFSSNSESVADMILDREHEVELDLLVGRQDLSGSAVVHFLGERTVSAVLPEVETVRLSEGQYNISVYVYGDSQITIPGRVKRECVDVAQSGLFGLFGATKEECYDIEIPAQTIDSVLLGGGKGSDFFLENQLENGKMIIEVDGLPIPSSLEQLQFNYQAFDSLDVEVSF